MDLKLLRAIILEIIGTTILTYAGGWCYIYTNRLSGVDPVSGVRLPTFLSAATSATIVGLFAYAATGIEKVMLNPMPTIAMMLTKQMKVYNGLLMILGQIAGAFGGASLLYLQNYKSDLHDILDYKTSYPNNLIQYQDGIKYASSTAVEGISTMFLCVFVLFAVVHYPKDTILRVLAASFGTFIGMASTQNVSGGSLGPLRVFPAAIINNNTFFKGFWIYLVGPTIGMFLAIILCSLFEGTILFGATLTGEVPTDKEEVMLEYQ